LGSWGSRKMLAVDDRWANAVVPQTLTLSLEIAGLEGHTAFVRMRPTSNEGEEKQEEVCSLISIVEVVLQAQEDLYPTCPTCTSTSDELFDIGAIWLVPRETSIDTAQNVKPRRARPEEKKNDARLENSFLRIHLGSIRYLKVYDYNWGAGVEDAISKNGKKKGVIILENVAKGFVIVKKPAGIPCHGYVYNDKENVVNMLGEALMKRYPNQSLAISCPQRLDTDTSGVLAVATRSSFSSYLGKLLQKKTLQEQALVTKRYQCLVCLRGTNDIRRLERCASGGKVITHYLLSDRTLPRVFRDVPEERSSGSNWLECRLRIIAVAEEPWGSIFRKDASSGDVCQVEIELLTGRPHQIRGQMSALGFPLLGDKMYGGKSRVICSKNRIALHCCELSFPEPNICKRGKKGSRETLTASSKLATYRCDAWWGDCL